MIKMLGGNRESVEAFNACKGKTITVLSLGEDDALHFTFDDGSRLKIWDGGQSCCESRYMRTDDKLEEFIGAKLIGATIKYAAPISDEWGYDHEIQFLDVETDRGVFQMASHNEHNGYYGGFCIECAPE